MSKRWSSKEDKKIVYRYRTSKYGVRQSAIRCPVCGNPINSITPIGSYSWDEKATLLAQCWSGSIRIDKPSHFFIIKINDLPIVEIEDKNNKEHKRLKNDKRLERYMEKLQERKPNRKIRKGKWVQDNG